MGNNKLRYFFKENGLVLQGSLDRETLSNWVEAQNAKGVFGIFDGRERTWKDLVQLCALMLQATGASGAQLLSIDSIEKNGHWREGERSEPEESFKLDISQVNFIDSVGLSALLYLLKLIERVRGRVELIGMHSRHRRLAEIYHLSQIFSPFCNENSDCAKIAAPSRETIE